MDESNDLFTPIGVSSEATQKAQMHPGSREEAEQQDEPGLALSPDGPGASPEPPSLTHTPDGDAATDTLASDLLRKLAGRTSVSQEAAVMFAVCLHA